jgi:hypothetical protein
MRKFALLLALIPASCTHERVVDGVEVLEIAGGTVAQRMDSGTVYLEIHE